MDLQKKHLPFKSKKLIIGMLFHHKRFFLQLGQKDDLNINESPVEYLSTTRLKKLPKHEEIKKTKSPKKKDVIIQSLCQSLHQNNEPHLNSNSL